MSYSLLSFFLSYEADMTKVQIFTDKNQQGFLGFPNAVKANGLVFTSGVRSKPKNQREKFLRNATRV